MSSNHRNKPESRLNSLGIEPSTTRALVEKAVNFLEGRL
jgi:hypothetical protein